MTELLRTNTVFWRVAASGIIAFGLYGPVKAHPQDGYEMEQQSGAERHAQTRGAARQPFSVRMHIHGPFSEETGSISSMTAEAALTNVDVLWWSDHDFGFTHNKAVLNFDFEDWSVFRYIGEDWLPTTPADFELQKYLELVVDQGMTQQSATLSDTVFWQGQSSLRIDSTAATSDLGQLYYTIKSDRDWLDESRALAGQVTLNIAILPELVSADAYPVIDLVLSYHGLPPVRPGIRYYLSDDPAAEPVLTGGVYFVPLPFVPNQWNEYALNVTADATAGFPGIIAEDNNLRDIRFGMDARNNARAVAYFDSFSLDYEITDSALFDRQRQLLTTVEAQQPAISQFQGTEHSFGTPHLNQFSLGTQLIGGNVNSVVSQVHAIGGLISLNHLFGTNYAGSGGPDPQSVLDNLLAVGVYGADILEAGYRRRGGQDLPAHLWVWDQLAANGYFLVGTGVSDFHDGRPGLTELYENNFVSWVWALSRTKADILDGLKRGSVFFGDILLFDGAMDLAGGAGAAMGQIVVTDRDEESVTVDLDGLLPADEVRFVRNGSLSSTHVAATPVVSIAEPVVLDGDVFVRAEVWRGTRAAAFSNPIYFVRGVPAAGIRAERAAIDLQGIVSRGMTSLTLQGAGVSVAAGESTLNLTVEADNGTIVLDYAGHGVPGQVTFDAIVGSASVQNELLTLSGLSGTGTIAVSSVPFSADSDGDQVPDTLDNCIEQPNTDQNDTDEDNIGNACDPDIAPQPNDCAVDFNDLSAMREAFFSDPSAQQWNPDADFDGDQRVNFADLELIRQRFFGAPGPSGLANDCDGGQRHRKIVEQ